VFDGSISPAVLICGAILERELNHDGDLEMVRQIV
jgi:hypothetical protein